MQKPNTLWMLRGLAGRLACVLALGFLVATSPAQAAEDESLDAVSKEAATLEATLSKVKDTSPEGSAALLKLVDLYHANGRVFGLIRVAEAFVTKQPQHPQHKAAMLKLIDGLEALSRNKELTATCRQFITRYPKDAECARLEVVLAGALEQLPDRSAAAQARVAIWTRQPTTAEGRNSGAQAIRLYDSLNSGEGYTHAAEVAESMVEKLPAGSFAAQVAMQGFADWRRAQQWAKANTLAAKILAKNLLTAPDDQRHLYGWMAENYQSLNQWASSADSLRKAKALLERQDIHTRLIAAMNNAQAAPADLEPVVKDYLTKYPTAADRYTVQSYLAQSYFRAMDKAKGLALLAALMPFDAVSNNNASTFVQQNGNEPAKLAESEQTLLAALAKNEAHAGNIRYTLATEIYRDRVKDLVKARAMFSDIITKSPTNDGVAQGALGWLLYNSTSEDDFKATLAAYFKARAANYDWPVFRNSLAAWINEAKSNKDHVEHAKLAQAALASADQDPVIKDWIAAESGDGNTAWPARMKLFAPDRYAALNDRQAWGIGHGVAEFHRSQGDAAMHAKSVDYYAQLAKRFPKNPQAAYGWLSAASDYGTAENSKAALVHWLTVEPEGNNTDAWRRMMMIADRVATAEKATTSDLVKQSFAYIQASQKKFGVDVGNAETIGDALEKYGMKEEAVAQWRSVLAGSPNSSNYRQSAQRLLARLKDAERAKLLQELLAKPGDFQGEWAVAQANDYLVAKDFANFEKTLAASRKFQDERPFSPFGIDNGGAENTVQAWLDASRGSKEATVADKTKLYTAVRALGVPRPSAWSQLALLELEDLEGKSPRKPMDRLLAYQAVTLQVDDTTTDWDRLMGFGQALMVRKDYPAAATLVTGLLANVPNIDAPRKTSGRDMVAQSYARMGGVGLAIDESSPIAPLLQAALYLRLGDERLAFETYSANKVLFDQHRAELPVELITFVCESLVVAGGDENLERAEDVLRGWLVKNSEVKEIDDSVKAGVQLLLAKNFFKAQRFDVARNEYSTVINRYPKTPQATEAEFGIGESFMAQKVYDQAEAVFEKLAGNQDRDIVIRAEFLRGVLANRRGDREEARDIFRAVLERVPNIELANQALYNLAEVYGAEERYIDQLELLRTVGRLGRSSMRWHTPGAQLSIVVQDSDLGISRGHSKIPVRITTEPGGDEELIYLYSGGAGKGLFRADLDTKLGSATKHSKILELTGKDIIKCDYPDEFKAEFRSVPLSDAEIRIAANATLVVSGAKIIDEEAESFSQRLEREARELEAADKRLSQNRPANQIKPGNLIYMKVEDADRDLSDDADKITVKLTATSGDQVQASLVETGPHTGIFEATAQTGELPAGALASDSAIDHSPLMAIDQDKDTAWLSEPDGAAPKWLAVDMKDLRRVDHVTISSPDPTQQIPVRGQLQASYDGKFWFRVANQPPLPPADPVVGDSGPMKMRVYAGNFTGVTDWKQVVELTKTGKPIEEETVETISWKRIADAKDAQAPHAIVWHGKLVQSRDGAARVNVQGNVTALMVDGTLELAIGPGNRSVDLWLTKGSHDVTFFSAIATAAQGASAAWTKAENQSGNDQQMLLQPFRVGDFDLEQPGVAPAVVRKAPTARVGNGVWDFQFQPLDVRHVRLMINEYLGQAVAINSFTVASQEDEETYIPTKTDVLSLSNNEILEIAAGDTIVATYSDEFTQSGSGRAQVLKSTMSVTYFNAIVQPIAYDFVRQANGRVDEIRKLLMRIDPGEKFVLEIRDYDMDTTGNPDTVTFKVAVNDGEWVELTAQETKNYSGIFTKEVETSSAPEPNKLVVKAGDRITCKYIDAQNTFPGHATARETVVYVNSPSEAKIRIVDTRVIKQKNSEAPPQFVYLPPVAGKDVVHNVAFEAPLTIEVLDRDAAKDSRSHVTVKLETTSGATIDVNCVIPQQGLSDPYNPSQTSVALEEGRFIGQVLMQLGGKGSPDIVPLTASMPRNLIGGGKLPEEEGAPTGEILAVRVLNVGGQDTITASYNDALRPKGPARDIGSKGRLIANGTLASTDRDYEKPVTQLHVGERIYLIVTDADLDITDERDMASVEISSERGEKETVKLEETLAHSGVFTGSIAMRPSQKPTPENLDPADPAIETYFGDTLTVKYFDKTASTENGTLELELEIPVVVGTDGIVSAFSKAFDDESLAVETQFHIAESCFELFKSHKALGRKDEQREDLQAGRRVLREVMEDYPNPRYVPRISYLLGQFSQELQRWDEAIASYQLIVRQYPDNSLAADAQYKLAQCYEESGDFENALEAYVTLAATYPKSPLIANVMIRISDYFYKKENFVVSAQVGEKFLERFDGHEWAPRMAFRVGQCYYKGKQYAKASAAFDKFSKTFPEDKLSADALFWSGESFRMGGSTQNAFRRYNRCRWDFPASEAAKYARGRLALPEMLQQFESEANLDE